MTETRSRENSDEPIVRLEGVTKTFDKKSAPLTVDVLHAFKVQRVVNHNGEPKLLQR